MREQNKISKKSNKLFWLKLMWVSVGVITAACIIVNICLAYKFDNQYTNLFATISGWISVIATLLIGVIAYLQSHKYQKENEKFIQEQKDLAWKTNYANVCLRFLNQLKEHDDIMKKYQPHRLEAMFLKNLEEKCFYDYELLVDDFESDAIYFLLFFRKSIIFNRCHKEVYDALVLFYVAVNRLIEHYEKIMSKKLEYNKEGAAAFVRDALEKHSRFIDLINVYIEKLNLLLFDINEESILILKASFSYQREEQKKWYNEVKDLRKHIQKLENKTTEIGEQ